MGKAICYLEWNIFEECTVDWIKYITKQVALGPQSSKKEGVLMRSRCHLQIMRRVTLRLSGYQKEQSAGPDSGICSGKESSLRLETKAKRIITLFSRLGKQSFLEIVNSCHLKGWMGGTVLIDELDFTRSNCEYSEELQIHWECLSFQLYSQHSWNVLGSGKRRDEDKEALGILSTGRILWTFVCLIIKTKSWCWLIFLDTIKMHLCLRCFLIGLIKRSMANS